MDIIVLILFSFLVSISSQHCANNCFCAESSVLCDNANLGYIPSYISPSVSSLTIRNDNIDPMSLVALLLHPNLQHINLSNCSLENLGRRAFWKLADLLELDLRNNKISTLPPFIFSHLRSLSLLNLKGNNLTIFDARHFENLRFLEHLNLNGNYLLDLKTWISINQLTILNSLDLGNNNIREIPEPFSTLSNSDPRFPLVEILNLNFNKIDNLHEKSFQSFPRLKTLYLNGCGIKSLNEHTFIGSEEIRTLILSNNKINSVPRLSGLLKLEVLRIANNNLVSISEKSFSNYPNLLTIDIRKNNALSKILDNSFTNNLELVELYVGGGGYFEMQGQLLQHNKQLRIFDIGRVKAISRDLINWGQLQSIQIRSDNLECSCNEDTLWLQNVLKMTNKSFGICTEPHALVGKDLASLTRGNLCDKGVSSLNGSNEIGNSARLVVWIIFILGTLGVFMTGVFIFKFWKGIKSSRLSNLIAELRACGSSNTISTLLFEQTLYCSYCLRMLTEQDVSKMAFPCGHTPCSPCYIKLKDSYGDRCKYCMPLEQRISVEHQEPFSTVL